MISALRNLKLAPAIPYIGRRQMLQRVPGLIAASAAAIATMMGASFYGVASIALFVYSLIWYVDSLGEELGIVPVIAVVSTGQWLLGPYFAYAFDAVTEKYLMYVDEQTYFGFALPGLLAFLLALIWLSPKIYLGPLGNHLRTADLPSPDRIRVVYLLGVIVGFLDVPEELRFATYLLSQFTYVALYYMIVVRMPDRWAALVVGFGLLILGAAEEGVFHPLLLWSSLLLSLIFYEFRLTRISKLVIVGLGILLAVQVQITKGDYREIIEIEPNRAGLTTMIGTILDPPPSTSPWVMLNVRINQGWIISAVMAHVPDQVAHQNGGTIVDAVIDSLVPRVLVEKRAVMVSEAFRTYTGLTVAANTSFGISVLGEAWVNFAYFGILFMGVFGAFYGVVMLAVLRVSRRYQTFVLWTPLFFLQALKMETELVVVLNHIAKSFVFVLILYFLAQKIFRVRL